MIRRDWSVFSRMNEHAGWPYRDFLAKVGRRRRPWNTKMGGQREMSVFRNCSGTSIARPTRLGTLNNGAKLWRRLHVYHMQTLISLCSYLCNK